MIISKSLTLEFFCENYTSLIATRFKDIVDHLTKVEGSIQVMLAIEDDRLIGVVFYSKGRIYYIYIAADFRGDGYGYRLFKAACSECVDPMALVPLENNLAVAAFSRWGFNPVSVSMYNYFDRRMCLRMEKLKTLPPESRFGQVINKDLESFLKKTPVIWNHTTIK